MEGDDFRENKKKPLIGNKKFLFVISSFSRNLLDKFFISLVTTFLVQTLRKT